MAWKTAASDGDSNSYDVIIIGAGMVGASIGCALGQEGMTVALIDPAPPAAFDSRSAPDLRVSALSPASIDFLDSIGVWSAISAMRTCPYRRMAVWEQLRQPLSGAILPSRFNQTLFDCREVGTEALGVIVENRVTQLAIHRVIEESLPTVELITPAKPMVTQRINGQAVVTLTDGRQLRGRLLIGADGAHSFVRQSHNIGLTRVDYQQRALIATVEVTTGPLDITWQAFTATGPVALLPLPECAGKNYVSLVWYNLPEPINRLMALSDAEFFQELRTHFPPELPELVQLVDRGCFPLARQQARSYVKEGIALVGDAAHTINPLAGQGVNLGFQDALVLSETIIKADRVGRPIGSVELLGQYEAIRRPENIRMQRVMDLFYHLFSNNSLPLKIARNAGLALVGHFSYGRKKVMRYGMGLDKPPIGTGSVKQGAQP